MQTIHDWIHLLQNEERPIIVEGVNDKKALESYEIKNIFTLNGPLYQIIETISDNFDSVIILTDLDSEGKKLYGILSRELGRRGIKIIDKYREFLFEHTSLAQIEGLASYARDH